jgi:hypothetical protein
MEENGTQESNSNSLCKCPHCACCFCNEEDLKRHIEVYGNIQTKHSEEFRRTHGRLEHGFSVSE